MGGKICGDKKKRDKELNEAIEGPFNDNAEKSVKLVLVGDATVGKSCLIVNY